MQNHSGSLTTIEAFAPAKINLTLHVTGVRADGYHLLDSLVVFADVGDRLWLSPGAGMALEVSGPFADGVPCDARNLAWRAAECAGWQGRIALEKNLPHGAGIGGGSSDAAAVLRSLWAEDMPAAARLADALSLGADVPVCLSMGAQRMQGIGAVLSEVPMVPAFAIVLVNPGAHVPTPEVFKRLDEKDNSAMSAVPRTQDRDSFLDWLSAQRNDLETPARGVAPVIGDALGALFDARLARMSGSGATVFGLYADTASAARAAARIRADRPAWWVHSEIGRAHV